MVQFIRNIYQFQIILTRIRGKFDYLIIRLLSIFWVDVLENVTKINVPYDDQTNKKHCFDEWSCLLRNITQIYLEAFNSEQCATFSILKIIRYLCCANKLIVACIIKFYSTFNSSIKIVYQFDSIRPMRAKIDITLGGKMTWLLR